MRAILCIFFTLLVFRARAETSAAESPEFPLELGSPRSVAAVTSAEFPVDLRMKGGVASSGSAEFVLSTKSGIPDTGIQVIAPSSIFAGQKYACQALVACAFADGTFDDSQNVTWFVVGDAPAGTQFEGNLLIGGHVAVPTVIRIAAGYRYPWGGRESAPVNVTIHPAQAVHQLVATYSSVGPSAVLKNYTLTCNAAATGPDGPPLTQNIQWDLDQDGDFDDATGLQAVETYDAGQTVRVGVRAEWPQAGGAIESASKYFFVTFEKAGVAGEPPRGIALDAVEGSLLNASGDPTAPLASLKANGLVVITHGLNGGITNPWLGQMLHAIAARLTANPPNLAIYDWHEMADASDNGEDMGANDLWKIKPNGNAQGVVLADWIEHQRQLGSVDKEAKIHLIGHSAGGFVVGETARILNQRGYMQVQATLLDTPLPYKEHFQTEWRTERYISSPLGGNLSDESGPRYYQTRIDPKVEGVGAQHSASREYYLATITEEMQAEDPRWADEVLGDGFNQSFLVNDADFYTYPQATPAPQNDGPQPAPPYVPPMDDLSSFGDVQQTGSVYRVTEAANAGIFKNLTLPIGATTLQFHLQVITPGDGDFVSVHWNDGDALAIIPETALAYGAPLLHEIDLTGLGGQTGTLTLKLISRGVANSVVEFSEIRILESDDVDGDGLTNAEESIAGSDVFDLDSDGDSLTDGHEVHTLGTNPMLRDSDGDGQDDGSELGAGTNPVVSQSRFAAAIGPVVPGVSATVHWNGVAGKSYRVVRSQELGTLNMDFLKAGLEGVNGTMSFEDDAAPPDKAFYWIEVE